MSYKASRYNLKENAWLESFSSLASFPHNPKTSSAGASFCLQCFDQSKLLRRLNLISALPFFFCTYMSYGRQRADLAASELLHFAWVLTLPHVVVLWSASGQLFFFQKVKPRLPARSTPGTPLWCSGPMEHKHILFVTTFTRTHKRLAERPPELHRETASHCKGCNELRKKTSQACVRKKQERPKERMAITIIFLWSNKESAQ